MVPCAINVMFRVENQKFPANTKTGNNLISIDIKLAQLN